MNRVPVVMSVMMAAKFISEMKNPDRSWACYFFFYLIWTFIQVASLFSLGEFAMLNIVKLMECFCYSIHPYVLLKKSLVRHKAQVRPNIRRLLETLCISSCTCFAIHDTFCKWHSSYCYVTLMPNDFTMMLFAFAIPILIDWREGIASTVLSLAVNIALNPSRPWNINIASVSRIAME